MNFLEKLSESIYIIRLNVKTNSKTQKMVNNEEFLTIFLNSKPIQNKANKELINLLKKKLKISSNQIQIISGSTSKEKLIKISFLKKIEKEELISRLFAQK